MSTDLVPFGSLESDPNNNYLPVKPKEELLREYRIKQSLIAQGVPKEIADTIIGYRPDQVPFIYRDVPHEVLHHRVRNDWTEGYELIPGTSSLWVGTTDAIWNMYNENGWNDQIPEVVVQWRGRKYTETEQQSAGVSIERQEVKHLSNGGFVLITYSNVSQMGEFDGQISDINVYIPEGTFNPYGGPARNTYRIYGATRRRNPNMDGVPGGQLTKLGTDNNEWSLNLTGSSNVSGTTILNGFQEMVNFHLADLKPVKEDFDNVTRFSALPEGEKVLVLPANEEEEFEMVIREETGLEYDSVMALMPDAVNLMQEIAPLVVNRMQSGSYNKDAVSMEVDGILRHPEKIWVLNKRLSEISRKQRFVLARMISISLRDGQLLEWLKTIELKNTPGIVNDICFKNARYLLMWFKRSGRNQDFKGELEKATLIAQAMNAAQEVGHTDSYVFQHAYDGFASAIVERYIEFLVQKYLGNSLV